MKNKNILIIIIIVIIVVVGIILYMVINSKKNDDVPKNNIQNDSNVYNINYKMDYVKSKSSFKIIVENVSSDLVVTYNNEDLLQNDNKVIIDDVKQGIKMIIIINKKGGKSKTEKRLIINTPFYNEFYTRQECENLRDKINVCANQFLDYKLTEDTFESTIANYGTTYN